MKQRLAFFHTTSFHVLLFLSVIGLLVHYPMLQFGLTSDHLQALYEWRGRFIVPSIGSFQAFINPYGASAVIDRVIDLIWGSAPFPYFFFALITKIAASWSVYSLSRYIFRSSLLGVITASASLLLFAGIQAAVPGATIYISLLCMNIGFLKLFKVYDGVTKDTIKESISIVILFMTAFAITPTRMYGIAAMLMISEVTALLYRKASRRGFFLRLLLCGLLFMWLKQVGLVDSYGTASGVATNLTSTSFYERIPNLPGLLVFTLGSYSQVFIPDVLIAEVARLGYLLRLSETAIFFLALLPGAGLFLYLAFKTRVTRLIPLLSLVAHCALVLSIMKYLSTVSVLDQITVYMGGIIANALFVFLLTLWLRKHHLGLSAGVFFGTPLIFMMAAYFVYPLETQETLSRYFAASAFGAALILGYFAAFVFEKKKTIKPVLLLGIASLLIYNAYLIRGYYISAGEDGTYNKYLTQVYKVMDSEIGSRRKKPRAIVFVKGDNPNFLSTTVTNQGDIRFSLEHNDLSENQRPIFVADMNKLKDLYMAKDPKERDINAIYGFEIRNKKAYSITSQVREYLSKEVR